MNIKAKRLNGSILSLSFLFSLLVATVAHGKFSELEVQYPFVTELQVEEFLSDISHVSKNDRVVAILGAGPAGLAAANQLKMDHPNWVIGVFDRRTRFSRNGRVALKGFAVNALSKRSGFDNYLEIPFITQVKTFSLFYSEKRLCDSACFFESEEQLRSQHRPNYQFDDAGVDKDDAQAHIAIKDMQNALFQFGKKLGVYHFGGYDTLTDIKSMKLNLTHQSEEFEIPLNKVDFLILSDGAHSPNREQFGFKMIPQDLTPGEVWRVAQARVKTDKLADRDIVTYGKWNEPTSLHPLSDIFMYNLVEDTESGTVQVNYCLNSQQIADGSTVASDITEYLSRFYNVPVQDIVLGELSNNIPVKLERSDFFSQPVFRNDTVLNVLLMGDAAAHGSPVAGLGASLAISFETDVVAKAIAQMEQVCNSDQKNMMDCLRAHVQYGENMHKTTDLWFSRTKNAYDFVGSKLDQIKPSALTSEQIRKSLVNNSSLTDLDLGSPLPADGIEILHEMTKNTQLKRLQLSDLGFSSKSK